MLGASQPEKPLIAAGDEGAEAWRRALGARVRSIGVRSAFQLLAAGCFMLLAGTPQAVLYACLWLPAAFALNTLEASALKTILTRRLQLTITDRIEGAVWVALSGVSSAVLMAMVSWSDAPGSRIMTVLLFFTLATLNLSALRDARAVFFASITPAFVAILAGLWTWLVDLDHGMFATGAILATAGVAMLAQFKAATAFNAATQSLRDARRSAETAAGREMSANRAKSEFLAVISHELRTPMNAMLGSAELIRRTDLSREQHEHLEALMQGGEMLLSLLNDMLDMAKIEAGAMACEAIPISLEDLTAGVKRVWQGQASEKGLALQVDVAGDLPSHIASDPTRLRQILFNLMSNAVKFTERGGVVLEVARKGESIVFTVSDTGPGIPEGVAARLFQPFAQADTSTARRFGGTGLGLSICRGLATAMGGEMALESLEGKGASFSLRLPLIAAEPVAMVSGEETWVELGDAQILVAEDHPANRRLLGALLQPLGLEVIMACDGCEVVDLFGIDRFDVVLMDVQMPNMDGLEATRQIRAMGGWGARVPIIALTANASLEDKARCLEAGMTGFLTKPIDPRALHSVIVREVVESRRAETRLAA